LVGSEEPSLQGLRTLFVIVRWRNVKFAVNLLKIRSPFFPWVGFPVTQEIITPDIEPPCFRHLTI
jgi:hypothetical protein